MRAMSENPVAMRGLLTAARRKQASLVELTRKLVLAESPSTEKAAVDACMAVAAQRARQLGGRVEMYRRLRFGDVMEARFGPRRRGEKPLLLLGHLDTVWPLGTLKTMRWRVAEGRLWGPGVLDMKAGVAMALTALELLSEAGLLGHQAVLMLTGDEEVGSPESRAAIERVAASCGAVLVMEPAQGLAYKTSRKGTGNWRIEVKGVAAHAGVDFEKGANALRELARAIETVSGWTDLKRGLTVSADMAGGGTASNVVPAEAWAEVDVRIARAADGARMARRFAGLKAVDKRCTLTATGGINRPPMERTQGTLRLFATARELAAQIGLALEEASTGGGSDGNFTSAMGIPTLDGMGAVGEGAHARHESVMVEELAVRTAMIAGMMAGRAAAGSGML
jgi:glutamate carboxypeptidase